MAVGCSHSIHIPAATQPRRVQLDDTTERRTFRCPSNITYKTFPDLHLVIIGFYRTIEIGVRALSLIVVMFSAGNDAIIIIFSTDLQRS